MSSQKEVEQVLRGERRGYGRWKKGGTSVTKCPAKRSRGNKRRGVSAVRGPAIAFQIMLTV